MSKLLVADDNGTPWVEITADEDGYHADCRCGERISHHREPDLIEAASIHVDRGH